MIRSLFFAAIAMAIPSCASRDNPGFAAQDAAVAQDADPDGGAWDDVAPVGCGTPTTVSGTVFDPAGKRPLYNVIVYVPSAPVAPFPSGVTCDQCGAPASGSPIASAVTGPDGKFRLENVRPGTNVPLVLQIGKWRRQLVVPSVAPCTDTKLDDPNVMRLPRNRSEGDMPLIAIATGYADPFECLLRKIGVDDAEFTNDSSPGRVHIYEGHAQDGGGASGADGGRLMIPAPSVSGGSLATTLWSDLNRMKRYDLVVNACEGDTWLDDKTQSMRQNLADYANAGGRAMATHYQYTWIADGPQPFPRTANFADVPSFPGKANGTIDTSFPKGAAFAEWLVNVGGSMTKGTLDITQPRFNVSTVNAPSLRWIYGTDLYSRPALFHYTFNTPVGAPENMQCGKVLFSDFHVEATGNPLQWLTGPPPWTVTFPKECPTSMDMTPNDLAIEFMLFDLSSCIQNDTNPPRPPR